MELDSGSEGSDSKYRKIVQEKVRSLSRKSAKVASPSNLDISESDNLLSNDRANKDLTSSFISPETDLRKRVELEDLRRETEVSENFGKRTSTDSRLMVASVRTG